MTNNLPPLFARERWLRLGAALALLAGLAVLAVIEPRGQPPFPTLPCGFRGTTGLPCAFCGGTRAAHALLNGDLSRTLDLNALAIPAVLLVVIATAILLFEAARGRRLTAWPVFGRRVARFLPVFLLLMVGWWIPHIVVALKKPNTELVDLKNPVAAELRRWVEHPEHR